MIRALLFLTLMAMPAAAQTRDEVFEALWGAVNGVVADQVYSQPSPSNRSQVWPCETCGSGQSLRLGWYDWAYNYDTTDPDAVLRAIAQACQFDPCTTQPYAAHGVQGLIQYGTHRRGPSARTYLIFGNRMWSAYAQGAPHVDAAVARATRAEAMLLPLILAAQP
jgi:hypothetical protein